MKTDFEDQAELAICRLVEHVEQITPRDLFAAFALSGMLAQPNGNPLGNPHGVGLRWYAAAAYDLADAMMDQRKDRKWKESQP